MKKFRSFIGRNAVETFLKIDYFGTKSQKSLSAGGSAPRPLCLRRLGASPPTA